MPTPYTGPSIVDYLNSIGHASDYNTRSGLASTYGITGYSGTADQNTRLLNALRNVGSSAGSGAGAGAGAGGTPSGGGNAGAGAGAPSGQNPTINNAAIIAAIQSGQVDPNNIDQYINDQILNSYRTSYGGGSGDNSYLNAYNTSGVAAGNAVRAALNGLNFGFGGQQYQYTSGGVRRTSTAVNQSTTSGSGTTATTGSIPGASYTPPPATVVTTPAPPAAATTPPPEVGAAGAPVAGASGGTSGGGTSSYTGPSVVDYLNSTGQASDFTSRSRLAASLGISGYTGTAAQNTQMLNTLRSRGGGGGGSTTAAGAAAGASGGSGASGGASGTGTGTGTDQDTTDLMARATAIAKSFGWVAPDHTQSPLNIATNLFTQGLAQYGLNDLKTQINSVLQQQTDLMNKKADEASEVNSNPWLTEGERVGKLSKLDDKYATKLDILTHQQQLYEADYKTGLDQVQWQVGQAMSAYNTSVQANDKIFSDALSVAENIMQSQAALAKDNKPISVSAGSTLYDPKTGKAIFTAPSKASAGGLTTPATNDAAVRAGVDIDTFKGYPADVQAFFSQKSDVQIDPIKTALTDVATGKKKASDFTTQMKNGDFGTVSPAVQKFLNDQATQAEKAAPPPGQNKNWFSTLWDNIF